VLKFHYIWFGGQPSPDSKALIRAMRVGAFFHSNYIKQLSFATTFNSKPGAGGAEALGTRSTSTRNPVALFT